MNRCLGLVPSFASPGSPPETTGSAVASFDRNCFVTLYPGRPIFSVFLGWIVARSCATSRRARVRVPRVPRRAFSPDSAGVASPACAPGSSPRSPCIGQAQLALVRPDVVAHEVRILRQIDRLQRQAPQTLAPVDRLVLRGRHAGAAHLAPCSRASMNDMTAGPSPADARRARSTESRSRRARRRQARRAPSRSGVARIANRESRVDPVGSECARTVCPHATDRTSRPESSIPDRSSRPRPHTPTRRDRDDRARESRSARTMRDASADRDGARARAPRRDAATTRDARRGSTRSARPSRDVVAMARARATPTRETARRTRESDAMRDAGARRGATRARATSAEDAGRGTRRRGRGRGRGRARRGRGRARRARAADDR